MKISASTRTSATSPFISAGKPCTRVGKGVVHASTAAQAAISRAQAEADTIRAEADLKRVETLKHLQQMVHVYDLALTTYVQPDSPGTLTPRD